MADEPRPGLLERLRDFSARIDARRSARSYLIFAVLFLTAALLWTRLPLARPWVRSVWVVGLLALAVRDFAFGLRRLGRERERPEWTWKVASAAFAVVGAAVALALAWSRR